MDADENTASLDHAAQLNDDYLRHPETGGFFRNPFKDAAQETPICLSANEFEHNRLEDALLDWHCISVSQSGFQSMTHGCQGTQAPAARSTHASLGRLPGGPNEFAVTVRKSRYAPTRGERRRVTTREVQHVGTPIDKLGIEVSDVGGSDLRVEALAEGLVLAWNRANPRFEVRLGDHIVRVNNHRNKAASMLEELIAADDIVRLQVRPIASRTLLTDAVGDATLAPSEASPGSLGKIGRDRRN